MQAGVHGHVEGSKSRLVGAAFKFSGPVCVGLQVTERSILDKGQTCSSFRNTDRTHLELIKKFIS